MPATAEPSQLRVPDIPGSYYDRIMEARWHDERGELAEAAAIYQRVVDRIANLPERRRPAGSDLNLYLSAAAAGLVRMRANLEISRPLNGCASSSSCGMPRTPIAGACAYTSCASTRGWWTKGYPACNSSPTAIPTISSIGTHWPTRQSTCGASTWPSMPWRVRLFWRWM